MQKMFLPDLFDETMLFVGLFNTGFSKMFLDQLTHLYLSTFLYISGGEPYHIPPNYIGISQVNYISSKIYTKG